MSKFKFEMVPGEDGKLVCKWTPVENETESAIVPGAVYGDFVKTDAEHIEEAKSGLLKGMFAMICGLAAHDNFWIVKPAGDGQVIVAWKAEFPQMLFDGGSAYESKDVPVLTLGEK